MMSRRFLFQVRSREGRPDRQYKRGGGLTGQSGEEFDLFLTGDPNLTFQQ
jgi:hypothetical protein